MNESANGHDDRSPRERLTTATRYSADTIDLESIVVRYENRPDRCTITPRECSEVDRLTTWLSADVEAIVDLADVR